jgi:hypothetical protein
MISRRSICSVVLLTLGSTIALAGPVSSSGGGGKPNGSIPKSPLITVAPGVFELGKVRLDKKRQCISFPAKLNMNEALVEYLLVTRAGKTHESLLKTEAEPYHIHTAMLLLGARGAEGKAFPEDKTKPIPGDRVHIELSWTEKGEKKTFRGEDWIVNQTTRQPVERGDWIYVGSRIEEGAFKAQQDGSIISLIEDPDALINNPRPGRDNDDNWRINSTGLPPLESAVEVTIYLDQEKPKTP